MSEEIEKVTGYNPINTVIGEGAQFNGEFILDGPLRVDGIYRGKIVSDSKVIVGPHGRVLTNIEASVVVVAGVVEGNIIALDYVHLLSSAKVIGDIVAANLIMDEGVIFEGRARINKNQTLMRD